MDTGIGAKLRNARNRRQIDLAEVERATKIRRRFLRAMENEDWDDLPGGVYRRNFIRTYGSYLGLDGWQLAEEYRRSSGEPRPGERGAPRADPVVAAPPAQRHARPSRRAWLVLAALCLLAALLVIGLSAGEKKEAGGNRKAETGNRVAPAAAESTEARNAPKAGLSVRLSTDAEVWVCLLDADGTELIDGQVLPAGAEEGPFRSDSFTVSFGNGEVSMWIDGRQASIPATSSPIGYEVELDGALRSLPEGERPTCL